MSTTKVELALQACSRCGEPLHPEDEDPEIPGLGYCRVCGKAWSYDA